MDEHVSVTATITDRHGAQETVYAGSQPRWAWEIDRCEAWRKVMRRVLLEDRTSDPRGWRVEFTADAASTG